MRVILKSLSFVSLLFLWSSIALGFQGEKRIGFTIPEAPWTMTLPADNFELKQEKYKPNGSGGYFFIADENKHLNVSFFIEPVGECKSSKACRDMLWKAGNPNWENPQNVALSEIGEASILEFLVPTFQGRPIRQQNMYAQFVVDGFWVDLHLSKVFYKAEERALFERLVKAIRFEPKKKS